MCEICANERKGQADPLYFVKRLPHTKASLEHYLRTIKAPDPDYDYSDAAREYEQELELETAIED